MNRVNSDEPRTPHVDSRNAGVVSGMANFLVPRPNSDESKEGSRSQRLMSG